MRRVQADDRGQQLGGQRLVLGWNIDRQFTAPTWMLCVEQRRVADPALALGFGFAPKPEETVTRTHFARLTSPLGATITFATY